MQWQACRAKNTQAYPTKREVCLLKKRPLGWPKGHGALFTVCAHMLGWLKGYTYQMSAILYNSTMGQLNHTWQCMTIQKFQILKAVRQVI